ncbi:MAG: hypothetical protein ACLUNV_05305 [Sutterella wadsworthensis]
MPPRAFVSEAEVHAVAVDAGGNGEHRDLGGLGVILEDLAVDVELGEAGIIAAAEVEGECIVEAVAVGARLILIDAFNAGGHEDRAVLIADGACVHALDAGLAFRAVLVGVGLRVGAKGYWKTASRPPNLGVR